MIRCLSCQNEIPENSRFCPICGATVAAQQAAPQPAPQPIPQPMTPPPVMQQQTPWSAMPTYTQPVATGADKAKSAIGFTLGILSFLLTLFAGWPNFIEGADYGGWWAEDYLITALLIGMFMLAAAIVGVVLSSAGRRAYALSGLAVTGKVFSIISIVLSGLLLFVTLITLSDL